MRLLLMHDKSAFEQTNGGMRALGDIVAMKLGLEVDLCDIGDYFGQHVVNGVLNPAFIGQMMKPSSALTLIVTGYDLVPTGMNFCYGVTFEQNVSVVSTRRAHSDPYEVIGLSMHEVLHQRGFVNERWVQHDGRSSFSGHCSNASCLMRPVGGSAELAALVCDLKRELFLCEECHAHF